MTDIELQAELTRLQSEKKTAEMMVEILKEMIAAVEKEIADK